MKTVKANGENAQISFVDEIKAWSISSKNVCLLARDQGDINQNYTADRFHFARLMAHSWFEILDSLSQTKRDSLKK
jgi:hypothetical protein